jgi:SAM-dependent methyltransferase
MQLPTGIPRLAALQQLQREELYQRHVQYNRRFLEKHGAALAGYGRHWGQDPFKLWSRRWEYPFAAEHTIEFARSQPPGRMKILDAGSGVTYFPYFLCDELPHVEVVCVDSDKSYHEMFAAINRNTDHQRVSFVEAMLQKLPLEDGAVDAICCISVLEHTDNYAEIIAEFARALRTGGALVLTFDLSLDGKFPLSKQTAADLMENVLRHFAPAGASDLKQELQAMDDHKLILTTDYVKRTEPQLLPWKYPMAKAVHDLVKGHGWTGGFRSKSVFCLEARKK